MGREALIDDVLPSKLSLAEWLDLPEDEPGELVEGRLEEEEAPDFVHEALVALLAHLFAGWVFPRGGMVAGSEVKLVLGERLGRKPDLVVYLPGSPLPPRRGPVRVPPDIAVEVLSPKPRNVRRDRVEKLADYAAFGIRFFWLVDPELRTLEVLELGSDGRYVHALGASSGIFENVPGCEGLVVDLDGIWATIDRLTTGTEGN
ncbi:MAG TPA: Uma2 family endonuclease [Thermoanaerobaculia bacterium]|nr:Uma2 family endonuclease [Thermoanaerobaculia bacterium]